MLRDRGVWWMEKSPRLIAGELGDGMMVRGRIEVIRNTGMR